MSKFLLALIAVVPLCSAQTFPAFRWVQEIDGSGMDQFAGIGTDATGNIYIAGSTSSPSFPTKAAIQNHLASPGKTNCFVAKLDPSGNVIYSTYFGGTGGDSAFAMAVDPAGNVYVTGTTGSTDFPTTPGTFMPVSNQSTSFLFRLNPDGSLEYSTYFTADQEIGGIAVDPSGSVYIAGFTSGGLPVTPGAFQTTFPPQPPCTIFCHPVPQEFLARFNPAASALVFATYLTLNTFGGPGIPLALAPDGSAYVGIPQGIDRIDATGSSLVASLNGSITPAAMVVDADGNLYVAGTPYPPFSPTPSAFQTVPNPVPDLLQTNPAYPNPLTSSTADAIAKLDPLLHQILAASYFYSTGGNSINSLALDAEGNVYAGGYTSPGLPTRAPLFGPFGAGFLSELSGDLSKLLFSSYFGAHTNFGVQSVAVEPDGHVLIAGPEVVYPNGYCAPVYCYVPGPSNIWVNSLTLSPPPALRIDSIVNAASLLDGPTSAGETIQVRGAGFGSNAQLIIGGLVVPAISASSTQVTAVVPAGIPNGAAEVVVQSGGSVSNQVLVPMASTSPGIFSANGTGYGQGYIINQDGSLNTPDNPAVLGDRVTIYATGIGPVSFTDGYAVTEFPSNVFIGGVYCDGVAAYLGPVTGFPGSIYRLTVYVPNPPGVTFPKLNPIVLQMNGVASPEIIAISISNRPPYTALNAGTNPSISAN